MSIGKEDGSSPLSKMVNYLGITLPFQFLGFVTSFVYSSYFNQSSTFAQSYVFQSSDSPPTPSGFFRPPPFGNHFFGDYLWIYAEIKNNGLGGYFGASQLFLIVASKLPYYFSLLSMFVISFLLLGVAAKLLLSESGPPAQMALIISGFIFTQPALLAIDRGQIHLLLFALLIVGLTMSVKEGKNRAVGAILIAVAISMKLTPIFFLLLFVRKRNWRALKISLISLIGFLLLPLVYLQNGIGAWRFALGHSEINKFQQDMYFSDKYFIGNLAHNNSFKLLGYYVSQMGSHLGGVGGFVYDNYFPCAALISIFLFWLILQKSVTQFEAVLLMAIASSLLIPIASGYTLMLFILPLVVVLTDREFTFTRLNIVFCCYIGIMLMPKQIALGFRTFEDSSITLGGIMNPSLSLLVIGLITVKCLYTRRESLPAESREKTSEI